VLTDRYWIYQENFLRGPYQAEELAGMKEFTETLLVCQDGDDKWQPVRELPAFRPYIKIISTGDYPSET
jgi:hypothetical protein